MNSRQHRTRRRIWKYCVRVNHIEMSTVEKWAVFFHWLKANIGYNNFRFMKVYIDSATYLAGYTLSFKNSEDLLLFQLAWKS